jgi:DNA-binding transcriptional LysR family regulator
MSFDNVDTIKRAIENDHGVGLLPVVCVETELRAGTLVQTPVRGLNLARRMHIVYRRGRALSPAMAAFIDILQQDGDSDVARPTNGAELRTKSENLTAKV